MLDSAFGSEPSREGRCHHLRLARWGLLTVLVASGLCRPGGLVAEGFECEGRWHLFEAQIEGPGDVPPPEQRQLRHPLLQVHYSVRLKQEPESLGGLVGANLMLAYQPELRTPDGRLAGIGDGVVVDRSGLDKSGLPYEVPPSVLRYEVTRRFSFDNLAGWSLTFSGDVVPAGCGHEFGPPATTQKVAVAGEQDEAEEGYLVDDLEYELERAAERAEEAASVAELALESYVETKGVVDPDDLEYLELVETADSAAELVEALADLQLALDPSTGESTRQELFEKYSWSLAQKLLKKAGLSSGALALLEVGWGIGTPIGEHLAGGIETVADEASTLKAVKGYQAYKDRHGLPSGKDFYYEYQGERFYFRASDDSFFVARRRHKDWLSSLTFGLIGGFEPVWVKLALR